MKISLNEVVRVYLVNILEFDLINGFHLHANFFEVYRTGTRLTTNEYTDTIILGQAERAILEFRIKYPGRYMFHAHVSEFAELGWACSRCGRECPGDGKPRSPLVGAPHHSGPDSARSARGFRRGFLQRGTGIRTPDGLPPVEDIEVTRILLPQPGLIVLTVVNNSGADPVTIAQVHVDEAYWRFDVRPAGAIPRLHAAAIRIPYPWVQGEPHEISLVTSTGASFTTVISVATQTPSPAWDRSSSSH